MHLDNPTPNSFPTRPSGGSLSEDATRILIVEDDPAVRDLLETMLGEESDHAILTADNGQQAFELLQEQVVEIIVTDWMMEKVDGLELVRRVRASPFPNYVYIIVLTAKGQKSDVVKALEVGADDYLTKPFDLEELQARVAAGVRRIKLEKELRTARDEAVTHSKRDALTGVLNRAAIMEQAEAALAVARREGSAMSVVILDVDRFKDVNDQYGHLVGDELLRLLADTVRRSLRGGDWVGRWGGDEFLLVMSGATLEGACAAAERVRKLLDRTFLTLADGTVLSLHGCLGVADAGPTVHPSLRTLLERADEALYRAKRGGRNLVIGWTP